MPTRMLLIICSTILFRLMLSAPFCRAEPPPAQERTDLEKVYDLITVGDRNDGYQKLVILTIFDVARPDVTRIMLEALNDPVRYRGDKKRFPGGLNVMAAINYANPDKGLNWLLDHYGELNEFGRAGLIESLKFLDHAEAVMLVSIMLRDETVVPKHWRARAVMPAGYVWIDMRVRDIAYNRLIEEPIVIERSLRPSKLPAEFTWARYDEPVIEREAKIKKFEAWWREHAAEELKGRRTLGKKSTVAAKIEALDAKLRKK